MAQGSSSDGAALDLTVEALTHEAGPDGLASELETAESGGNESGKQQVAVKNPVLVRKVVELKEQGRTISQIERELDISRPTVRKYLRVAGSISSNCQEQLASLTQAITDEAYKSIHAQIVDRNAKGDGRLALDWMKMTVFAEKRPPVFNVAGDATINTLNALLAGPPAAPARIESGEAPITIEPAPGCGQLTKVSH